MPGNKTDAVLWKIAKELVEGSEAQNRLVAVHGIVRTEKLIEVYIVYKKDLDVVENERNGISDALKGRFLQGMLLSGHSLAADDEVAFHFDSQETVDRDFQGSYIHFLGLFY
jgi:hypothetical protein